MMHWTVVLFLSILCVSSVFFLFVACKRVHNGRSTAPSDLFEAFVGNGTHAGVLSPQPATASRRTTRARSQMHEDNNAVAVTHDFAVTHDIAVRPAGTTDGSSDTTNVGATLPSASHGPVTCI